MKLSILFPALILATGLAADAQARIAAPEPVHIAPATIELDRGQCVEQESTPCVTAVKGAAAGEAGAMASANGTRRGEEKPTPVPEPRTFVMLMLGLVVLGFASRHRDSTDTFSDNASIDP